MGLTIVFEEVKRAAKKEEGIGTITVVEVAKDSSVNAVLVVEKDSFNSSCDLSKNVTKGTHSLKTRISIRWSMMKF